MLQYRVQWFGTSNGDTGLIDFSLSNNTWQKVSIPNLTAPAGATEAVVTFRIVTGAVGGAKGEIFIDTLEFSNGVVSTPDQITSYALSAQKIAKLESLPLKVSSIPSWNRLIYKIGFDRC